MAVKKSGKRIDNRVASGLKPTPVTPKQDQQSLQASRQELDLFKGSPGTTAQDIQARSPVGLAQAEIAKNRAIADFEEQLLNTPSPNSAGQQSIPKASEVPTVDQRIATKQTELQNEGEQTAIPLPGDNQLSLTSPGTGGTFRRATDAVFQVGEIIQSLVKPLVPTSEFLDFSASKSPKVKKAEQAFTDMTSTFTTNLELVRANKLSYAEAYSDADLAIESIISLESGLHGLGKLDLSFWQDNGLALETQILKQKRAVELYQEELLKAAREGALTQAQGLNQQL